MGRSTGRPTFNDRGSFCRWCPPWFLVFAMTVSAPGVCLCDDIPPGAIEVRDTFLRVREEARIPALEGGQIQSLNCQPGDLVSKGQLLGSLDQVEAELTLELARLEHQIALKTHSESVELPIASANLEEARELLRQTMLDAQAATLLASQDIAIRQAQRESEVSAADFERATVARKEFSSAVSDKEYARLALARDQDVLKLERARFDQNVEKLRSQSREAMVGQQGAAVRRLEQTLKKATTIHETAALELSRLEKQRAIAETRLQRRHFRAPFSGMIVEKLHTEGEWVEAGEPVLRLIQLDVLSVEGFTGTKPAASGLRGRTVVVDMGDADSVVQIQGKIVFVSPESDPINSQIRIRAEIPNPDQKLLPGQPVRMWIPAEN